MRTCVMAFLGLLTLCASGQSLAGAFSVSPVRVFLEPRDRAAALTLVNGADAEVVLQADVMRWSQDADGQDRLEPSDDLLISPPILKLPPRSRQVVRLARLVAPDLQRQQTYRLLLREVPDLRPTPEQVARLPITLVLSIPVFLGAPAAQADVQCELHASQPPQVACRNQGRAHAQVRELSLLQGGRTLARFDGAVYLLPGSQRVLPLKPDDATHPGEGEGQILLKVDEPRTRSFPTSLR